MNEEHTNEDHEVVAIGIHRKTGYISIQCHCPKFFDQDGNVVAKEQRTFVAKPEEMDKLLDYLPKEEAVQYAAIAWTSEAVAAHRLVVREEEELQAAKEKLVAHAAKQQADAEKASRRRRQAKREVAQGRKDGATGLTEEEGVTKPEDLDPDHVAKRERKKKNHNKR